MRQRAQARQRESLSRRGRASAPDQGTTAGVANASSTMERAPPAYMGRPRRKPPSPGRQWFVARRFPTLGWPLIRLTNPLNLNMVNWVSTLGHRPPLDYSLMQGRASFLLVERTTPGGRARAGD